MVLQNFVETCQVCNKKMQYFSHPIQRKKLSGEAPYQMYKFKQNNSSVWTVVLFISLSS